MMLKFKKLKLNKTKFYSDQAMTFAEKKFVILYEPGRKLNLLSVKFPNFRQISGKCCSVCGLEKSGILAFAIVFIKT